MEAKNKEQTDKEKAREREKSNASKNTFKDSRESKIITRQEISERKPCEIGLVD